MRIIVTGGAGFIGSWVAQKFIEEGHSVSIIDNLSQGKKSNIPRGARFYKIDIQDDLEKVFEKEKPDIVSHHAAQIDVRKSICNPRFDAGINIIGTLNLLENSIKCSVRKFIFASSGGVMYGEADIIPAPETSPINIFSPYGVSKRSAELYLLYYKNIYCLNYIALRYGNVYGPRQDPHGEAGVVAIFIQKMLEGKVPTIFGDGRQTRDYVYVEDVVKANILALKYSGRHSIFNIGTGKGTSVNWLYKNLSHIIGFNKKPDYKKPRKGELQKSTLDAHLAIKELGWSSSVELEQGLKKTVEYFKNK
ncbi:UDP-glucose 4-epimerase [bacterium Unc6]|nr:UDP-glucose 4-epimerase [bacterium Unc6]